MQHQAKSIRAFIGAKDFEISRNFYRDLGFQESIISTNMCYFNMPDNIGFYLQDAYVKDWVDNTQLFMEVADIDQYWDQLNNLRLQDKYDSVRLVPMRNESWGKEFFLHDPAGILWHFGAFNR